MNQPTQEQQQNESLTEPTTEDVAANPPADSDALQQEIADLKDQLLRAQADVQNMRRRCEEDVQKARKFGIESFAESMLAVVDSLEAGLSIQNATQEQLREGSETTLRQLLSALERNKVVVVAPEQGEKFDPNRHQAIAAQPAPAGVDIPPNSVVATLQKGYLIADRVLRPAMVMVTPS